jgi:hypothetical protein
MIVVRTVAGWRLRPIVPRIAKIVAPHLYRRTNVACSSAFLSEGSYVESVRSLTSAAA